MVFRKRPVTFQRNIIPVRLRIEVGIPGAWRRYNVTRACLWIERTVILFCRPKETRVPSILKVLRILVVVTRESAGDTIVFCAVRRRVNLAVLCP